jgi:hypothetical protein
MAAQLTDAEIAALLAERKPLARDFWSRLQPKEKRGHKERELDVAGESGTEFRLIVRQSVVNPLDFSVILAHRPAGTNQLFRLRRYNGRSHEHTNPIERQTFYDFHVHTATERYQELGLREDTYAEPADRFSDLEEALRCMLKECGFDGPEDPQASLF